MRETKFYTFCFILFAYFITSPFVAYGQPCSGGLEVNTPLISMGSGTSQSSDNVAAGEYFLLYVCNGADYTISTCAENNFDTYLTLIENETLNFITDNNDACGALGVQSSIDYTATFSGWIQILLTENAIGTGCVINPLSITSITINQTSGGDCAPDGYSCTYPLIANVVPFSSTGLSTCLSSNEFDNSSACGSFFFAGPEFVIEFSPPTTSCYTVEISNSSGDVGLFVLDNCNVNAGCIDFVESAGDPSITLDLDAGTTYYFFVSTDELTTACTDFDIDINECPEGTVCSVAETISEPFDSGVVSTCGSGDDYDNTDVNGGCTGDAFFMTGDDYVYSFTPTTTGCFRFDLENTDNWMGLFVYDDCPDAGGTCQGSTADAVDVGPVQIDLTSGTEYFIVISSNPGALAPPGIQCGDFQLLVEECPPGSTCADPFIIPNFPYSVIGGTTCGFGFDYTTSSCGDVNYITGEDYVMEFSPSTSGCYTLDFTNTDTFLGVFVWSACPDGGSNCVDAAENGGADNVTLDVYLEASTPYYIVVSTFTAPDCSSFDFELDSCDQGGETCANPVDLSSGSATGVTTCAQGDNYDDTDVCESTYMNGQDVVFEYTAPTDGCFDVVVANLSNTSANMGVFILDGCPDDTNSNCVGSGVMDAGGPSTTVNLLSGTTYTIIVASNDPNCTDFDISITSVACPAGNICSNPIIIDPGLLPTTLANQTSCDAGNDYTIADLCGATEGDSDDVVFEFTPDVTDCYTFEMVSNGNSNGDADVGMFILDDCPDSGGNCLVSEVVENGMPTADTYLTAGETYYIVISAIELTGIIYNSSCQDFDLMVTGGGLNCPEGVDCNSPLDVGLGTTSDINLCGLGNDYDETDACGGFYMNGEDVIITFTPPATDCYNFLTEMTGNSNLDADVGIYVLDDCPDAVGASCLVSDEVENGFPEVDITLTGGQTYFIMISAVELVAPGLAMIGCTELDLSIFGGSGDCPPGLTCENPINLPGLGLYDNMTSCGFIDDYDPADIAGCNNPLGFYLDSEETVMTFTPTESGCYIFETSNGSNPSADPAIFIFDDCPDQNPDCIATGVDEDDMPATTAELVAGVEYYIVFSAIEITSNAGGLITYEPSCTDFDLDISSCPPEAPSQDCIGAIPVCQDTYDYNDGFIGAGSNPDEIPPGSCLFSGELNSVWFVINVETDGDLGFLISPDDIDDDYDFAVYDITDNGCEGIPTGASQELSCNFSISAGVTGATLNPALGLNSQGAEGTLLNSAIPVLEGQTLVLIVSNFSTSLSGFNLDFSSSTASIFDTTPPEFDMVVGTVSCDDTTIDVTFDEPITCASLENCDFELEYPDGSTQNISDIIGDCSNGANFGTDFTFTIGAPMDQNGTYSLNILNACGGVEDNCENIQNATSITFDVNCSNCSITSSLVTNIVCNNNGTLFDQTDDTYTFDVTVSGVDVGASWSADDIPNPTVGAYDTPISFGPFDISGGDVTFTVTDIVDLFCTSSFTATAPTIPTQGMETYNGCMGDGYSVMVNNTLYNEANPTGMEAIPMQSGCDSIVNINLVFTPVSGNEGPFVAIDLTTLIDDAVASDCGWLCAIDPYLFSDGLNPPSVTTIEGDPLISCVTALPANQNDIWFKFTHSANQDAWLDLYQTMEATPDLVTVLYEADAGGISGDCDLVSGLTYVDCADNAGLGGPRDVGDCTTPIHNRLDISGLIPGREYYVRIMVWNGGGAGPLSFEFCAERSTTQPGAYDDCSSLPSTVMGDNTPSIGCTSGEQNVNIDTTLMSQSNVGAFGNEIPGCSPNNGLSGTAAGNSDYDCDGGITVSTYLNNVVNNNVFYSIFVNGDADCLSSAYVRVSFENLISSGGSAQVQIVPGTCPATSPVPVMASSYQAPGCFTLEGNLANGLYYIVVDGQDATLLCYDLHVEIEYTGPTCETTCCDCPCEIDAVTSNIVCSDNNTPSDPTDDTYTFDLTVTGVNNGASWNADDPNNTTGAYGGTVNFGPYDIGGGDLNFTITDIDDTGCTTDVMVTAPATCSDACEIEAVVGNILCDDNNTPTDPSDDTFTFDVTVTGDNNGASWTANDPNTTTGTYGGTVSFGPYDINGEDLNFIITDINDTGCISNVIVTAPASCSGTCSIGNTVADIICDDNNTPNDSSDDTFTFMVTVTGSNTGVSWTADDLNNTTGTYGAAVSFGPYDISGGDLNFTITDIDDSGCTTDVMVTAPDTCSDACDIESITADIICDDNNTPTDPSDDTFIFTVTVTGSNTGASWTADDPNNTIGTYGAAESFGPYDISDGDLTFTITDIDDAGCTTDVMVMAPATCSDLCEIDASVNNILCDDNGTPTDPSDDTFTFELTITGENTGASWTADDPNGTSGSYVGITSFGPYDISNGNLVITIKDNVDSGCETEITVTPPMSCSDLCILDAIVSNIQCDNNGTPNDSNDDVFTFDVEVSSQNSGNTMTANDPNSTSGNYGEVVSFGPYSIAGGDLSFSISDDVDPTCSVDIMVSAPTACSNECQITTQVSSILCNDNGTPNDPTDDTFTFVATVIGDNTSTSWIADDPNGTTGNYGDNVIIGPYDISNGDLSFVISDQSDPTCQTDVNVSAPSLCSGTCSIGNMVSNLECNDNGTPTNPDDDTFTFDVFVTGSNTSAGWTASDANSTSGDYDTGTSLGPFNISNGDVSFDITDNDDPDCITNVLVMPPAPCSDVCLIEHTVSNILCNDNGTANNTSDDTFTFELITTGVNTGSTWSADDVNNTSGSYDVSTLFGPYDISDGDLSFTISDNLDNGCTSNVFVIAPSTCSDACSISSTSGNILCDDNGTPLDSSDDTFTFEITVTGTNTATSWTASDFNATTGSYGMPITFGPFIISDGNINLTIADNDDSMCNTSISITAPDTCSGTCSIANNVTNIQCDDNGTPSDPTDDTFTFSVIVTGSNTGAQWISTDPNSTSGSYDTPIDFGPYSIAGGNLDFTIVDVDDSSCLTDVMVVAPSSCSDECMLSTQISNILCDENGTPNDPDDDVFSFDILVQGENTGAGYSADDPNNSVGAYGAMVTMGPYPISNGNIDFTVTDNLDSSCSEDVQVIAPNPCSGTCSIGHNVANIECDDNGTPLNPSDDTFTFEVTVNGSNTAINWNADDDNSTTGLYGEVTIFGPYPITDGNLNFTITDEDDSSCTTDINVTAPDPCSGGCQITNSISNILCDNNGTPTDPTDDTFTFEINVSGTDIGAGWTADDPNSTNGTYNNNVTFGPYPVNLGVLNFVISDTNDATCTTDVEVNAPSSCSNDCQLTNVVNNILCDDNGTPLDPNDDTFTFMVTVDGMGVGSGWTADDLDVTSGDYNQAITFGPFNIGDGQLLFTITDNDDGACTTSVNVTPPNTCSGTCSIGNTVSNILCDDNGTPLDSSDDTFTFDVEVNGSNTGVSWAANDPNSTTGVYTNITSFGPYNISDGNLDFDIIDIDDNLCTTNILVIPPTTCSDDCMIQNTVTNILCDDNGSATDNSDDTFTFEVTVTGQGIGNSWIANDPDNTSGSYNEIMIFGPYPIISGDISFTISDIDNSGCLTDIVAAAPSACSDCNITAVISGSSTLDCTNPSQEITVDFTGVDIGDATIEWIGPDPGLIDGIANQTIVVPGTYTATVSDMFGCSANDTFTITSDELPEVVLSADGTISCDNPCIDFIGDTGVVDAVYTWSGPGVTENVTSTNQITVCEGGQYSLVITDAAGCESAPVFFELEVEDSFTLSLSSDEEIIAPGETVSIDIVADIDIVDIASIDWSPEICDDCETIEVAPLVTTTYTAEVVDINGCIKVASIRIVVEQNKDVFIPNVFTPEGFNNKTFGIYSDALENVEEFAIFDRWGEMVYFAEDLIANGSEGWDGRFNNDKAIEGVYTYYVKVLYLTGELDILKGTITLVR